MAFGWRSQALSSPQHSPRSAIPVSLPFITILHQAKMFSGSWLGSRTASGRPAPAKGQSVAGTRGKSSLDREHTPLVPGSPPDPTADEPKKRALTTALSTPHDAVLAELHGHRPEFDPAPQIDGPTGAGSGALGGTGGLNTLPTVGEDGETLLSTATASPNLANATPKSVPQTLYDPFTGAPLGVIQPQGIGASSPGGQPSTSSDGVRQELWTHLGKIRGLQADIASMHITMESIGETAAKRGARVRRRSTGGEKLNEEGGAGDDWDGDDWQKKDRDAEFEQSESRFVGRKEEIDAIMGKVRVCVLLAACRCFVWTRTHVDTYFFFALTSLENYRQL